MTRPTPGSLARLLVVCVASLVAPRPSSSQTVSEVFGRVNTAVAIVHTASTEYPLPTTDLAVSVGGMGSGVLISPTEVMTAAHVVQAANEVVVEFPSGEVVRAVVVTSSPSHDVALLGLAEPVSVPPVSIGDSDAVDVGDRVFVVGAPFGEAHTVTVGHVSARRRPTGLLGGRVTVEYLQTDAAINPGNSGGPMFNMQGDVVGIVSHILSLSGGFQGLGYAVTANTAREVLLEAPSFWSGIEGRPLTGALAALLNVPPPGSGILVQGIAEGSVGDALGLRPSSIPVDIAGESLMIGGDIILSAEGVSMGADLEGLDEVERVVSALPPRSRVSVSVLRAGRVVELSALLPY